MKQANACFTKLPMLYCVGMAKSPLAKFTRGVRVGHDEGSLLRTTPCACLRDEAYRQTSSGLGETFGDVNAANEIVIDE